MQPHPLTKNYWGKIDLIWANFVQFGRNLCKIEAKFGQNQNIASQKHSIFYSYVYDLLLNVTN